MQSRRNERNDGTMSKVFGEGVAVYTKDSVNTTNDDKKKQAVIDEWTDKLAQNMAEHTHMVMLDDGTVLFDTRQRRGGHNRQTIELLNAEGYIVKVFDSIADAAKYFGVGTDKILRQVKGVSKTPLVPGCKFRRRETEKERKAREKATEKANKKRIKTIAKKNKTRRKTDGHNGKNKK